MKLVFCPECHDVFKLRVECVRYCWCGKSSGKYLKDGLHAVIDGLSIPIGFDNSSFKTAVENRPDEALHGKTFTAFIIPKKCNTIGRRRR